MGRVFARLVTKEFLECPGRWVEQLQFQLKGTTVSIDGKTVRRSRDASDGKSVLHIVSAWASHVKFCFGQISVDSKSNEIPAVKELLEMLNLKGAVVTADAMHCQKETIKKIIEKEADYVVQVNENQPSLLATIQSEFNRYEADNYQAKSLSQHTTHEKNRSRAETRTTFVAPALASLKEQWRRLKTIGLICRIREMPDGTEQTEISYFISSLPPKVRKHSRHL